MQIELVYRMFAKVEDHEESSFNRALSDRETSHPPL